MSVSLSATLWLVGTAVVLVSVLSAIILQAARRAEFDRPGRVALTVGLCLSAWLVVLAGLGLSGVLAHWSSRPPRVLFLPILALTGFVLISRTAACRRLLRQIPAWQLVAVETFRVGVELAFWRLHAAGQAPVQITFEGSNVDAWIGLTAPVVAAGLALGRVGPKLAVAWNVGGLLVLGNAIRIVATSVPGPLRLDWPGPPFVALAEWPVVWVPGLLAPTGVFLHVLSIRQMVSAGIERVPPTERVTELPSAGPASGRCRAGAEHQTSGRIRG